MNKKRKGLSLKFQGAVIEGIDGDYCVTPYGMVTDKKTGEEHYGPKSQRHYYGRLGQALTHVLHHKLASDGDITGIESVLKKLHQIEADFNTMKGVSK